MAEITVVVPPAGADRIEGDPFLRVERGAPGLREIAVLVALMSVLAVRDAGADPAPVSAGRSAWNDPAELLRQHRYPRSRR